jgi:hypothetical protein
VIFEIFHEYFSTVLHSIALAYASRCVALSSVRLNQSKGGCCFVAEHESQLQFVHVAEVLVQFFAQFTPELGLHTPALTTPYSHGKRSFLTSCIPFLSPLSFLSHYLLV